jgi:hypothetical protein
MKVIRALWNSLRTLGYSGGLPCRRLSGACSRSNHHLGNRLSVTQFKSCRHYLRHPPRVDYHDIGCATKNPQAFLEKVSLYSRGQTYILK